MKNVLFLCARNRLRSPMAEQIFADLDGLEVTSAGVNSDADTTVSGEMLEDADVIFVMEQNHRRKLQQRFKKHLGKARIICLDIPDDFSFMQAELITLLKQKVTPHLQR